MGDQEAPATIEGDAGGDLSWPTRGGISFKEFDMRYREGLDLVLKKVSFDIPAGDRVGICGRTGSGKSSLMLALFRIVESAAGSIEIDGIDIASVGLDRLRNSIAIIPQ